MSPTTIIAFTIIGIVAVSCYVVFMSRAAVIKNKINSVPAKKISEVKDGETVSIKGKITLVGRTVRAPISNRRCAYYYLKLRDRGGLIVDNVVREDKSGDIVIFDGEDYAVIKGPKIEALVNFDKDYSYDAWPNSVLDFFTNSKELEKYMEKSKSSRSFIEDVRMNVYAAEGILTEGETVMAAGKASWKSSAKLMLNLPQKNVLCIEALNEHGVYLTEDLF